MSLDLHHLQLSQSERVVWLLEELNIPYNLHVYKRDSQTGMAPKEIKDMNPNGTAPYFTDTTVSPPISLSESGAIVDYILTVHAPKAGRSAPRLIRIPGDSDYVPYLQWLYFASGSLQPATSTMMMFLFTGTPEGRWNERLLKGLELMNARLGESKFLAGDELSAADIMTSWSLTTCRGFYPKMDLGPYENILRYLKDITARPAYREAKRKGDNGMEPMIAPKVKGFTQFEAFKTILDI